MTEPRRDDGAARAAALIGVSIGIWLAEQRVDCEPITQDLVDQLAETIRTEMRRHARESGWRGQLRRIMRITRAEKRRRSHAS